MTIRYVFTHSDDSGYDDPDDYMAPLESTVTSETEEGLTLTQLVSMFKQYLHTMGFDYDSVENIEIRSKKK